MKKGDIVRLDITASYAANGDVFETTNEALAKEKELWHEGHSFKPKVYIIGGESTDYPTGLELDLLKAKVGDKREITLEAKDAFGAHNPLLVETISTRELIRQGIEPEIGATVTRRNKTGHIAGVFGGRVRVDYNHPLAGKGLKYEYTVAEVADSAHDKALAVLDLHYGRGEEFRVHVKGKEADITIPDVCKFDQAWATQKLRVVIDLREHAGIDTVRFVEEYVRKNVEGEATASAEAEHAGDHKHEEGEHDHSAHDHAGHDHAGHSHEEAHAEAPKPKKAPAKKAKAAEAK